MRRVLSIRDSNLRKTGDVIARGQIVEAVGRENNGYIPVIYPGHPNQIFYVSSRYLQRRGPVTTQATVLPAAPLAPATAGAFPEEAAESTRRQWTFERIKYHLSQTGQSLINSNPRDISDYCPNYSSLTSEQRLNFWAKLMTEVVHLESNFEADQTYTESFTDDSGQRVVSTGLFQLSRESSQGYRCPVRSTEDLKNAETNISCAVRILQRWVTRDDVIFARPDRGGGRYWSVFRESNKRAQIRGEARQYCDSVSTPGRATAEPGVAAPGEATR